MSTRTRFEDAAKGNSEMAYLLAILTPREHRKPQNSSFNWEHPIDTGSLNAAYSNNLLRNSCHQIAPMAKLLHTPISTYNTPQLLYSL